METVRLSKEALTGATPYLASPRPLAAGEQSVKLGGVCPVSRPEAFRFAVYFNAATKAQPPAFVEDAAEASASLQRMYLSDRYRNSLNIGQYHAKAKWSANNNGPAGIVSGMDVEVFNDYQTICVPGGKGRRVTPVLNYFRDEGLSFNGVTKRIDGYVAIDWAEKVQIPTALNLYWGLNSGSAFPKLEPNHPCRM